MRFACFGVLSLFSTKTMYSFFSESLGGGELSISSCPGVGLDRQETKKMQIPLVEWY